ncbi:MAG TPA: ATP-binding protein, partial [Thermoanaerobaculia bacterium]|nr:ATP-binding protein [Thermoanaerobaculia bacterium]
IVTGKMQLSMRPLTVFDAIAGAVETIRPAADAKQIVIDLDIRARDARIVGDAERLQQVLWNLLSNAVKFTPRLGSVCVELSADADAVRIAVRDTGEGIAPELLPFIFDRFRQGDSGASRRFGGLGLGLAIARNLVEMHGGTITATSRGLGHGAELTVVLPAARETSDATASIVEAKEPAALEGLSLLVVEDDDSTRAMFDAALRQFGASVVSVGTTSAARDALSSRTFDAIVSDIGLPGEDGIDFLRGLRASGNRVPSIAVTAYAGSEERTRAFDAGFNVWLTKPIEPETLVNEVRNAVRMYHRTDGH